LLAIFFPIYTIRILINNPYEDLHMSALETSTALTQLRKVIASLQKEEMAQLQKSSGDALKQIVTIAREHSLTSEHIAFALKSRVPREKKIRVPKKNKFTQIATEQKLAQ
jgi:hypothetical protein